MLDMLMLYVTDVNCSWMKEWLVSNGHCSVLRNAITMKIFKSWKFYQPFSGLTVTLKRNKTFS